MNFWMEQVRSFDQELVSKGELTPVFFGSALTNFGVETFLEHFLADDHFTSSKNVRCGDDRSDVQMIFLLLYLRSRRI